MDLDPQVEPLDALFALDHPGRQGAGAFQIDLGDVEAGPPFTTPSLPILDENARPAQAESGEADPGLSRSAVGLGTHDRDHSSRIVQGFAHREAAEEVEEVEGAEVELLHHRLQRRGLFLIHPHLVIGLTGGQVETELAEMGRVLPTRLALGELHHVIVDGRQRLRLVVVPETLRVSDTVLQDRPKFEEGFQPFGSGGRAAGLDEKRMTRLGRETSRHD